MKLQSLYLKTALLMLTLFSQVSAQNEDDALRYSRNYLTGTARSMGMGGAFGALGSDFSSASINPAGLGLFRKSEISFTPQLVFSREENQYLNNPASDARFGMNIANLGFVLAGTTKAEKSGSKGWKSFAFGVGFNRVADFSRRSITLGTNASTGFLDSYTDEAQGRYVDQFDPFSTLLFYNTFLIDTVDALEPPLYFNALPGNSNKKQVQTLNQYGGINETAISFAGNYNDKVYLGGSILFQRARYFSLMNYTESDVDDSLAIQEYTYSQDINTTGSGVGFSMGVLVRPIDWFRAGASIRTPIFFGMNDSYTNTVSAQFDDGTIFTDESPMGEYMYRVTTPFRAGLNTGFIIAGMGVISVDYEYIDYRNAVLSASDYSFSNENAAIRGKYNAAHNLRFGTEWKIDPFFFRAGYAMFGSPFELNALESAGAMTTFGAGYRDGKVGFDLAWYRLTRDAGFYLHRGAADSELVKSSQSIGGLMATMSLRF